MFANLVRVPAGCAVPTASSFDHYFDQLFRNANGYGQRRGERRFHSKATDEAYELTLEIPGFNKEEVSITVEDKTLIIKAVKTEAGEKDTPFFANTERKFALPEDAKDEAIAANLTNGVLTLKIPRVAPEKVSRKIEIS
jgi:HSP20 family molecular chaperone IbpA